MFKSSAQKKREADAKFYGNKRHLQETLTRTVACGCANPANCTTCRGSGVKSA